MNRPIKFRAWEATEKKFYYWGFIDGGFSHAPIRNRETIEQVHKHSQQFTGLKDKNGTEIYEGDIVERQKIARGRKNGTVQWIVEWQLDQTHNGWNVWQTTNDQVEVIGNIYENPELLK